jgi:CRP/FNR family transcriptional regulator
VAEHPQKLPIDCQSCRARRDGLCTGLAPETLRIIAGHRSGDRKLLAGQDLFGLGEPYDALYNLVDGWMFRYTLLEDGRRQILDFALPGAVLGFHPAQGAMSTFGAEALTEATLCVIPHKAIEPLSRKHPEIALRLAWLIARDRSMAFDHLTSVGRHSARERVAHLLLELYIRCRWQWPERRIEELRLPLTQEHIGDATGPHLCSCEPRVARAATGGNRRVPLSAIAHPRSRQAHRRRRDRSSPRHVLDPAPAVISLPSCTAGARPLDKGEEP